MDIIYIANDGYIITLACLYWYDTEYVYPLPLHPQIALTSKSILCLPNLSKYNIGTIFIKSTNIPSNLSTDIPS